jgi:peptide/nickel transport system substrate-binding protein
LRKVRFNAIFQALNRKEKMVVSVLIFFLFGSIAYWGGALYFSFTMAVPDHGGRYAEGVVGQPRYLNPILSQTSAADRDLSTVLFDGLFGYDDQGKVVEKLAEHYTISDDGKTYTVTLRGGALWHDGMPVTAQDVLFTIQAIQDPAYKSPLRQNWQGIETEAKDDRTVVFNLKNA